MNAYRSCEIIYELVDLGKEILLGIEQQLSYYKVSVYKEEEAQKIEASLMELRQITDLLCNDEINESFLDYEATQDNHDIDPCGQSTFYTRTLKLVSTLSSLFETYYSGFDEFECLTSFSDISQKKKKLIDMCTSRLNLRYRFQDI